MRHLAAKTLGTSLIVAALAACGGGGGEGAASLAGNYAVGQGYANLLAANKSWTTSGNGSDGRAYTLTFATQRLADGVFAVDGKSYARARQTVTLTAATPSPIASPAITDLYFNAATTLAAGSYSPDDGSCTKVSAASALPAAAGADASGALTTETDLAGCTSAAGPATNGSTTTTSWSLNAARTSSGAVIALLCQNSTSRNASGASLGSAAFCIELNADGSLGDRAQVTVTVTTNNFSLTTRNY